MEIWGCKDKHGGKLTFANRQNIPFDWDKEYKLTPVLIKDNAVKPTPAPFPNIPAEMPGVELEANMPLTALQPDKVPTDKEIEATEAAVFIATVNFGPQE